MKKFLLVLLEFFEKEHVQKTGEKAEYSGIYKNGNNYIALTKGETLPPTNCYHKTCPDAFWRLVVDVNFKTN